MGEGTTVTISSALTELWTVVTTCLDFITDNMVLMVLFVSSLVIVAFKIVKKAKKSAKA